MAAGAKNNLAYAVVALLLVALALWMADTGDGDARVGISFVGYTNNAVGKAALFTIKNTGPYAILRDEVCTINWKDVTGDHVDFFHLDPKSTEIKPGCDEIVRVPITNALSWRTDFTFSLPPTLSDMIREKIPWRFRKQDDRVWLFLGPTLTNTPIGGIRLF